MQNYHKLDFRGIKTIYLISGTFIGILCIRNTTLKMLLKVINDNLLLKLESSFFLLLKPKMYLDNKLIPL